MSLTCREFEQQFHVALDERVGSWPAELLGHAAECAPCATRLNDWQRTTAAIAIWKRVRLPEDRTDAILAQLRTIPVTDSRAIAQPIDTPARNTAGMTASLLAALALLLMLGIGWRVSQSVTVAKSNATNSAVARHSTAQPNGTSRTKPELDSRPELDSLFHDARQAYAALASEAWQQVSITTMLLPPAEFSPGLPAEDSLPRVPDSLSRPLAPIRTELREAWESLIDQVFANSQDSST